MCLFGQKKSACLFVVKESQRFGLLRRQVRDREVHLPVIEKSQRFGLLRPAQEFAEQSAELVSCAKKTEFAEQSAELVSCAKKTKNYNGSDCYGNRNDSDCCAGPSSRFCPQFAMNGNRNDSDCCAGQVRDFARSSR